MRSENRARRAAHLVEFLLVHPRLYRMMPLSRYRDPKNVRSAALNHMNDYDSENQSCDHDPSYRNWNYRAVNLSTESVIQQKNRILGRYEDQCFMFGVVFDPEFAMQRDPVVAECKDEQSINRWQVGESFQSQWNLR
jgi:hypothetical protein